MGRLACSPSYYHGKTSFGPAPALQSPQLAIHASELDLDPKHRPAIPRQGWRGAQLWFVLGAFGSQAWPPHCFLTATSFRHCLILRMGRVHLQTLAAGVKEVKKSLERPRVQSVFPHSSLCRRRPRGCLHFPPSLLPDTAELGGSFWLVPPAWVFVGTHL